MGRRLGFCGGGEGSLLLRRGRSCGVGFVLPAVVVIMAGAALADVMLESDTTWNGSVVVDQTTRVPAGVTLRDSKIWLKSLESLPEGVHIEAECVFIAGAWRSVEEVRGNSYET